MAAAPQLSEEGRFTHPDGQKTHLRRENQRANNGHAHPQQASILVMQKRRKAFWFGQGRDCCTILPSQSSMQDMTSKERICIPYASVNCYCSRGGRNPCTSAHVNQFKQLPAYDAQSALDAYVQGKLTAWTML